MSANELIERMQTMFDYLPTKMDLRKHYKNNSKRGFGVTTKLLATCYDKMILVNRVPVHKDELTDYLIDGIPDEVTRNQARIQRFKKRENLLQEFEKIMLRVRITHESAIMLS